MDFFQIFSSLNKLSLIAFLATGVALVYEIYLLRKEKVKKSLPKIPLFPKDESDQSTQPIIQAHSEQPQSHVPQQEPVYEHQPEEKEEAPVVTTPPIMPSLPPLPDVKPIRTPGRKPLILLTVVVLFGLLSLFLVSLIGRNKDEPLPPQEAQIQTRFLNSEGIRLYNSTWKELSDDDARALGPSQTLFIGIETIEGSDIDMARIRVNENEWKKEHEVVNFNEGYKVFYRQYTIPEIDELKIEAQLHSRSKGWLGE